MKRTYIRIAIFAWFSVFVFISCKSSESIFVHMPELHGMVYDYSNTPVANYTLTISSNTGNKAVSVTDVTGRFVFTGLENGTYMVTGSKQGFEECSEQFVLSSRNQILYIRIASSSQLADLAADSLEKGRLQEAEHYVQRSLAVDETDTAALFCAAVLAYRKGDADSALRRLEYIEQTGNAGSTVYLFIADIYEYCIKDRRRAKNYLEKSMRYSQDKKLLERIHTLEANNEQL